MPVGRMNECFRQPRCVLRTNGTTDANLIEHPHSDVLLTPYRQVSAKCINDSHVSGALAYKLFDMGYHGQLRALLFQCVGFIRFEIWQTTILVYYTYFYQYIYISSGSIAYFERKKYMICCNLLFLCCAIF